MTSEARRLREAREGTPWRAWGPYLSERQWGTVREDYSDDGDAWSYFSHDRPARGPTAGEKTDSRASPTRSSALFRARALERARPDLEGAPLRADQLRRQPRRGREGVLLLRRQRADAQLPAVALQVSARCVPVREPIDTNRCASRHEMEYELVDTGVFDDNRYFDVEVEYVKVDPEDIVCRIVVHNRAPTRPRSTCSRRSGFATRGHGPLAIRSPGSLESTPGSPR